MKSIFKLSWTAALLLIVNHCTDPAKQTGWIDITPGENLVGWTIVDVPADGPLAEIPQWTVDGETGVVRCNGSGGRDWLRYDGKELSDFILHVEWKFDELDTNARYNSGVFVRNSAEFNIWHQAQMGSASGGFLFGNTLINGEMQRFNTRDQMKTTPVKPAGEWNTFDITCRGKELLLVVNGERTTTWDKCEVSKGFVGLEAEGFAVEFRNLRIKEL